FCTDSRPTKNYRPNDGNQRGYGYGFLRTEAEDESTLDAPVIRYSGVGGFSRDQLMFEVSIEPRGTTNFTAVQWRLAEISSPGVGLFKPGEPRHYEIETLWTSAEKPVSEKQIQLPPNVCTA